MNTANMANAYKQQQILTASPAELTLMLYNGAIRFINESIKAVNEKNLEKTNNSSLRAQDIVRELRCTLDMQYEISQGYFQLYEYIEYRLTQANLKKDAQQFAEAKELLQELRDAWGQAMKQTNLAKAAGNDRA